jgi:hypothetical protein
MNGEQIFGLAVTILIVTLICSVTYYNVTENNNELAYKQSILTAIQNGLDPLVATCAVEDGNGDNPTCVLMAARKRDGEI